MAADYEKIREENIARYGWDTAVLDLLGQLYSERTHFIFELIQNAEDAGATELAFELAADRLELRHDGRPLTEADVRGVCGVGKSGKSGDLTAIGKFGIGFKSVYAYTKSPRVYSARVYGAGEHGRVSTGRVSTGRVSTGRVSTGRASTGRASTRRASTSGSRAMSGRFLWRRCPCLPPGRSSSSPSITTPCPPRSPPRR